jgi:hypothetical protein
VTEGLKELIAFQREMGMVNVHLVLLRDDGFDLAHTDEERATLPDLQDCPVHRWLWSLAGPPVEPGRYKIKKLPSSASVSFRSDALPYELEKV